jgi:hypothetical protein|tara:strand:- start:359 stop:619 length:261 start_codon:yes stop_codon:yes gene_type:complete
MTKEEIIKQYNKTSAFPGSVNISFLRNELEPILKELHPDMKVSWACNSCVKSQMSILFNWVSEKEIAEAKKVKKKKNVRKRKPAKK